MGLCRAVAAAAAGCLFLRHFPVAVAAAAPAGAAAANEHSPVAAVQLSAAAAEEGTAIATAAWTEQEDAPLFPEADCPTYPNPDSEFERVREKRRHLISSTSVSFLSPSLRGTTRGSPPVPFFCFRCVCGLRTLPLSMAVAAVAAAAAAACRATATTAALFAAAVARCAAKYLPAGGGDGGDGGFVAGGASGSVRGALSPSACWRFLWGDPRGSRGLQGSDSCCAATSTFGLRFDAACGF